MFHLHHRHHLYLGTVKVTGIQSERCLKMSRTYKTDPLWIHIKKNRDGYFPIKHDHAVPGHEDCDAEENFGRDTRYNRGVCRPVFSYYNKSSLRYLERPSAHREYAKIEHAKARTATRNALAKAKYLNREDIEDFDLPEHLSRTDLWWDLL